MPESCSLCSSADVEPTFRKDGIPYFRCRACTFEFSRPARNPNLESRLEDYEDAYLNYLAGGQDDERNFDAVCAWMASFRALEDCRLLDVGCGGGKLVRHLRSRALEAHGIEPSKALFEHFLAEEPWFSNVELHQVETGGSSSLFDVVTAFDVIEHVPEPRPFLAAAARVLSPGGWLFLSMPDLGSFGARAFGRRWHYYNKYHLSYLSPSTLAAAARAEGFELTSWSHRGRLHSVGYAARYFLEFVLRRRAARIPRFLDRIVLPLNLYDVMYAALLKTRGGNPGR